MKNIRQQRVLGLAFNTTSQYVLSFYHFMKFQQSIIVTKLTLLNKTTKGNK